MFFQTNTFSLRDTTQQTLKLQKLRHYLYLNMGSILRIHKVHYRAIQPIEFYGNLMLRYNVFLLFFKTSSKQLS